MHSNATLFRRLLPAAVLLTSLTLASCGNKDCDPRPKHNGCGKNSPTSTTKPGGAS